MRDRCLNIVVMYDNYEEIKRYIDGVLENSQMNLDIIVVINRDTNNNADALRSEYAKIGLQVKGYGSNIGYLNALLYVIEEIDIEQYKFIILSNTDIVYNSERFFERLLNSEYSQGIGCIAPDVYSTATNTHSNPHYMVRLSKKRLMRTVFIFEHPMLVPLYFKLSELKTRNNKSIKRNSCYVYSPHGCYIILTSEFVGKIKGKRYTPTLYSEETWIAENLINYGYKCYYDSTLSIEHHEHTTTSRLKNEEQARLFSYSLRCIINEFYD